MAAPLDRVLTDDYLSDIATLPVAELRSRRQQCQEAEIGLSYYRRIVQTRLDIVQAERAGRDGHAGSGGPSDVSDLVDRLPAILADHTRSANTRGLFPEVVAPPDVDAMASELDAVINLTQLTSLAQRTVAELEAFGDRLTEVEHEVSARRRRVHDTIDALQAEIVQRYKSGEATVDALLR